MWVGEKILSYWIFIRKYQSTIYLVFFMCYYNICCVYPVFFLLCELVGIHCTIDATHLVCSYISFYLPTSFIPLAKIIGSVWSSSEVAGWMQGWLEGQVEHGILMFQLERACKCKQLRYGIKFQFERRPIAVFQKYATLGH